MDAKRDAVTMSSPYCLSKISCRERKQSAVQCNEKHSRSFDNYEDIHYQNHLCQHSHHYLRYQSHRHHYYQHRQGHKFRTLPSKSPSQTMLYVTLCAVLLSLLLPVTEAQDKVTLGPLKEEEASNYYVGNIASETGISRELSNSDFRKLRFEIMDDIQLFHIDANSGTLFTKRVIDREEVCGDRPECIKEFDVTVRSDNKFYRMVEVRVNITDINDNRPKFPGEGEIIVDIPENNEPGFTKPLPTASDPDIGQNSVQEYFLLQPQGP